MTTRRLLQGGEDVWPSDGGLTRGESFRKKLIVSSTLLGLSNRTVIGDKYMPPSGSLLILTHVVFYAFSGQTQSNVTGNPAPTVGAYLSTLRNSDNANDANVMGIQMPSGDWVAKGGNTGFNYAPNVAAGQLAVNGFGTRAIDGAGGPGNHFAQHGILGTTDSGTGYVFQMPYVGFSHNPVDTLAATALVTSTDSADKVAFEVRIFLVGTIVLP